MSARSVEARVYGAITYIRSQARPFDEYGIYMSPEMYRNYRRQLNPLLGEWHFIDKMFGLQVTVDPKLKKDQIVLRHEVEA